MSTFMGKKQSRRSRVGGIGHSVSVHTTEAGHKVREEFDEMAPKVVTAASDALDALHAAAHTAAERSRPVRAEAAARGSAALSGLLGEVTPARIDRLSGRASGRGAKGTSSSGGRGRTAFLLAMAGGAAIWVLWWKRSGNLDPRLEEVAPSEPEPEPEQDPESVLGATGR